jgi:hypothetical protein
MTERKVLLIFIFSTIAVSILARILPHPPNFAPIAALALFCGVYAARYSKWFLLLPLAAVFISDLMIGTYHWQVMLAVYASFAAIGLIGFAIRKRKNTMTLAIVTLSGSLLFFLATNFAVWAFSGMYPLTLEGLILSYTMALPFLKFTLLGDLFYAALFFGAYELALAIGGAQWSKRFLGLSLPIMKEE